MQPQAIQLELLTRFNNLTQPTVWDSGTLIMVAASRLPITPL